MTTNNWQRVPMDLKQAHVTRGLVHIIPSRCKGCNFCIQFCPEKVLQFSEEINHKGYHFPTVAAGKEDSCVHCRFCDLICPEMAIYTTAPEETEEVVES